MLGHLFPSKYLHWIISWTSIVWGLYHLPARAGIAEGTAADVGEQPQALPESDISELTDESDELSHVQTTWASEQALLISDDCTSTRRLSFEAETSAAVFQNVRSPQNQDSGAISEPQNKPDSDKKEPKSTASLLESFVESRLGETSPEAVSSNASRSDTLPSETSIPDSPSGTDESLSAQASSSSSVDPELGIIQVQDPRRDPELGVIELRNSLQDPELGILQLRQISPAPRRRPFVFLSTYVTATNSDNIFRIEDPDRGRFGDNFIRPGIRFLAFPAVGPSTNLLASVETNFLRYQNQSNSSYDEIRFQAGVRHRFSDRISGQLSFSRLLRFDEGYRDRFFSSNSVDLTISRRDILTPQLTLNTYYVGQVFLSDPERFSNVGNFLGASLAYRISPQWDTSLSYQLSILDFTQQNRHETFQQIRGQLRYAITPSTRVSLFGGLRYGRSSEDSINFDNTFFGISFDATFSLF